MKTIWALFEDYQQVDNLVGNLYEEGFDKDDFNFIVPEAVVREHVNLEDARAMAAARVSHRQPPRNLDSLLLDRVPLPVPDTGPVIALGKVASIIGKTAAKVDQAPADVHNLAGTMREALIDFGIPADKARLYSDGIKGGDILFAAQVSDERAATVVTLAERQKARQVSAVPD